MVTGGVDVARVSALPSREGHFWPGEAFLRLSSILVENIEKLEDLGSMGAKSGDNVKS